MATTAALTENSHQGINFPIPPCTGLEAWLSRNPRWGCGHRYDETPVDLVVYVRNDPVNKIDPDGRQWMNVLSIDITADFQLRMSLTPVWEFSITSYGASTFNWDLAQLYYVGNTYGPSGGGGSQNGSVSIAGNQGSVTTQAMLDPGTRLDNAISLAVKALEKPDCASLFDSSLKSSALLKAMAAGRSSLGSISLKDLGPGTEQTSAETELISKHSVIRGIYTNTGTIGGNIYINTMSGAPFMNGYGSRFGLDNDHNLALTLIHELGHVIYFGYGAGATDIITNGEDRYLSERNSDMVNKWCFN